MFAWVKVVISRCKYAVQDHVGSTREQEIFQPETALPLYGMELLEPRVMLSGTGLLSAPQLIDALPSESMVAITGLTPPVEFPPRVVPCEPMIVRH